MENDYTEFIDRLCNEYGEALYQYAARRIHNPEITYEGSGSGGVSPAYNSNCACLHASKSAGLVIQSP